MSMDETYFEETSNHSNSKTSENASDAFRFAASTRNIFLNRFTTMQDRTLLSSKRFHRESKGPCMTGGNEKFRVPFTLIAID